MKLPIGEAGVALFVGHYCVTEAPAPKSQICADLFFSILLCYRQRAAIFLFERVDYWVANRGHAAFGGLLRGQRGEEKAR